MTNELFLRRADLLKRRLGLDAMACPRCQTRMEWVSDITEPDVIGKVLRDNGH